MAFIPPEVRSGSRFAPPETRFQNTFVPPEVSFNPNQYLEEEEEDPSAGDIVKGVGVEVGAGIGGSVLGGIIGGTLGSAFFGTGR